MKIVCIDKDVKSTLNSDYYLIPRFQRPYLWERENVEDFWNDSIVDTSSEHFIGSIVVFRTREGKLGIVDGQQRLSTITMILCALRNAFRRFDLIDLAKGIHRLVERPDIGDREQYVLQTETSYPFFQEFIQKFGTPETEPSHGPEESYLKSAYDQIEEYLLERLEKAHLSPGRLSKPRKRLARKLLESIRDRLLSLKLIFIELDDEDDAYFVFETLNTRGKDLRLADLVKNHVTRLLRPKNQNVDLAKDKWNRIVDVIEENENIQLDSFLHHYWLSKYEYTTVKKLFQSLRKTIKQSNAKDFLDQLVKDSKTYRELYEPTFAKWSKQEIRIAQSLGALNEFRVKQDLPMILAVLRDYREGQLRIKHVNQALQAIEHFHFMFTAVTSQRSSGGISFMYAMHARDLSNATSTQQKVRAISELIRKLRDKKPTYAEFEASFVQKMFSKKFPKDKGLVQYILGKFYMYFDRSGVPVDLAQMTIEHLAPEKPLSGRRIEDSIVAQIGNLLLVNGDLNNQLANKEFHQKKPILLTSSVWIDPKIRRARKWGKREIEERTKYLAREAYNKIWKF